MNNLQNFTANCLYSGGFERFAVTKEMILKRFGANVFG